MRQSRCTLQFSENGVLMREEVTNEAVAVALVHGERVLLARAQNARSQRVCESGYVVLVRRGELDETNKVSDDGIQSGNVRQAQLTQSGLDDGNTCAFARCGRSRAVNRLDDLVNVRRDERIWKWLA